MLAECHRKRMEPDFIENYHVADKNGEELSQMCGTI